MASCTASLSTAPRPTRWSITVTVDEIQLADSEVDTQLDGLRERFGTLKTVERAAKIGDYVQLDLAATVDGVEVEGGSASNISHEVGSNKLLPGLDEAVQGMSAGDSTTFQTQLVGGDFAGKDADVAVTVRTVKEKELPALDDDFAQLASEFDTLDELRGDLTERLRRVKRVEQLYAARDKALETLVEATEVPAPEGVVREEVEGRKEQMGQQLEQVGASLQEYLESEGKTEEEIDSELTEAATQGVKVQLILDTISERENIEVSDDEYTHEVVHRAQRAGVPPQQYYDQLVRNGLAGVVYGDVRRGKALAWVLEQVKIADSTGAELSLADLRGPADEEDEHAGHNH
jgi:trigger factor